MHRNKEIQADANKQINKVVSNRQEEYEKMGI
jgi:hypothetical protein